MQKILTAISLVLLNASALADSNHSVTRYLDQNGSEFTEVALAIWDKAELGYLETESSALLQSTLAQHGFDIESGVADIPTAFVASYGSGKPVIAVLAEFDALPGISQSANPERDIVAGKNAGHACGHHLFGAGSAAAAVAVKQWMETNNVTGTLRLYGTPAEEGGSGKVYMVRAGLFDDVDVALHWHPGDKNAANPSTSLANRSAKFRFAGISAHAAASPERGRSALDGVEVMNYMVNLMREHVPQETRMHYVITRGGAAPNVVPDFAEVYYYVRHPNALVLAGIWDRVIAAAEGAAKGTGTKLEYEVIHGNHSLLPNETLAGAMHANLTKVGGVQYSKEEQRFAEKISTTLGLTEDKSGEQEQIMPLMMSGGMGSTDVGDVSWLVPTTGLSTATWVPGTAAHSWQAIAAGGTSIGGKGMIVAAKTLALTIVELLQSPELVVAARDEMKERRGDDFVYKALLGDRAPPLDYRVN
ncbi:MAG: aminobenzoyl-glutamate utilization protein B [Halioglobus sp.]|jgi:aminobenzoyl-glutamate utilization protein B